MMVGIMTTVAWEEDINTVEDLVEELTVEDLEEELIEEGGTDKEDIIKATEVVITKEEGTTVMEDIISMTQWLTMIRHLNIAVTI